MYYIVCDSSPEHLYIGNSVEVRFTKRERDVRFLFERDFNEYCDKIEDDDKFLFLDFNSPHIETVKKINKKAKIFAYCDNGSFIAGDKNEKNSDWMAAFDHGRAAIVDAIIYPNNFVVQAFLQRRTDSFYRKSHVLGGIWDHDNVIKVADTNVNPPKKRDIDIIYACDPIDANYPSTFLDMIEIMIANKEKCKIVFIVNGFDPRLSEETQARMKFLVEASEKLDTEVDFKVETVESEQELLRWLNRSRFYVSTKFEHGFDYDLMKACAMGCHPIMRDTLANKEMMGDDDEGLFPFFYYEDAFGAIEAMSMSKQVKEMQRVGVSTANSMVIDRIIDLMDSDIIWQPKEDEDE